jgi:hypothetical protein
LDPKKLCKFSKFGTKNTRGLQVCIDEILVVFERFPGRLICNFFRVLCEEQEFPLKSSLDPAEFGDPTSAISKQHIEGHLEGLSVEQVTKYAFKYEDTPLVPCSRDKVGVS